MRVPRINNYAEAVRKLNNTKPIKGREPTLVPLGERRDCDTYSIRRNIWNENMELVLYQTPVVKFTPDDEVLINFGKWSSASTCQFISRVLGIAANRVRGEVVLHFYNNAKALVKDDATLTIVRDSNGYWVPKDAQVMTDYRVSRKGANAVRARFSKFRDYLNGMMKLKEETHTQTYGQYTNTFTRVMFSYPELSEALGVKWHSASREMMMPNVEQFAQITKPEKWASGNTTLWENFEKQSELFYELVRNDQDDNVRHQNYWIALCALVGLQGRLWYRDEEDFPTQVVNADPNKVMELLEKAMFMRFSDEVFQEYQLDAGQVPRAKYADYVRKQGE
jgi:hypothetical protein